MSDWSLALEQQKDLSVTSGSKADTAAAVRRGVQRRGAVERRGLVGLRRLDDVVAAHDEPLAGAALRDGGLSVTVLVHFRGWLHTELHISQSYTTPRPRPGLPSRVAASA